MRTYIFLCLICWVRSGYFNLSTKSKPAQNKKTCLEFSKLNIKDSFVDLFRPRLKVILLMYSRKNIHCAEPLFDQNNTLNINFNTQKKTAWIIHGYRPTGSTPTWLQKFQSTLLMEEDMNVIVVDWSQGATTFIYNRAVKNTRVVADILSKSIINLVSHGASLDSFHFIGMSLGAHVSGFVGKKFSGQIGRITGLDPAGPKFSGTPPNSRLDYTDAKFVDIIHSDAEGLGIQEPLGHIDFYPNGGKTQPGCPKTVFSGYKAKLWKESLQSIIKGWPRRTIAFLDTTDKYPFCAYYFVLSIIPVDAAMNSGSITLKMLSQHGVYETANIYEKNKPFAKFQEVKILVTFLSDMAIISSIRLTYFQNAPPYCPKCRYRIYRLTLKSLTYPERPPFCRHNIVLREKQEVILPPESCTENDT